VLREKAILQRKLFTVAGSGKGNEVPRSTSETNYDEVMKFKGIRMGKDFEMSAIELVDYKYIVVCI
jgi:hypothetical protein